MKYDIVNLEQKIIVGISDVTSNNSPEMGKIIGGLWERLYKEKEGISNKIKNTINQFSIGLYSDYQDDNYCITVGKEVSLADNDELTVKVIPAGKYAKFHIHGNMVTSVAAAWGEIWQMDLDRSFTGDFEEYLNTDFENGDINIYIALK